MDAPCLLNHRLAGVGAGCRGRWAAAVRCRREVETDRGFDGRLARSGVRCRCRRLRGRRVDVARFRGSVRRGAGGLAAAEGLRFHVHGHLEAVAGAAGIEPAGQRALGHQPQRIRAPLCAARLVSLRGRRYLLQCRFHGAQHHRACLGGQPRPQHQHAIVVHPRAQRAARQAHLLGVRLRVAVRLPPRPHQPLHLRAGGAAGDGDQPRLGGRRGHPRQGTYDGVGKPAAGHGRGEVVEIGQRGRDAQLLARGAEVEAGAPVEPVGTGTEALPTMLAVELPQVTQQLVGGGLDACG